MTPDPALPWESPPDEPAPDVAAIADDLADQGEALDEPVGGAELALVERAAIRDLLDVRDPAEIMRGAGAVRDALVADVIEIRDKARAARGDAVVSHTSDIRAEATRLADVADVCRYLGGAFAVAGDTAVSYAADLLDDLPNDGHPRRSYRVGDGHGFDLVVKREPRKDLVTDDDEILDVLAAAASARYRATELDPVVDAIPKDERDRRERLFLDAYRQAQDDARGVLATSLTFRSTALDALVTGLQDAGEDELAKRLANAYARVEKGEPRDTLERVEPKVKR